MAAMKTLLMDILADLGLEMCDAYLNDGSLDPRVEAEYDRRVAEAASDG